MTDLLAALGIALFLEGVAFALFPGAMQKAMAHTIVQPRSLLRGAGVTVALAAVVLIWLVRGR